MMRVRTEMMRVWADTQHRTVKLLRMRRCKLSLWRWAQQLPG